MSKTHKDLDVWKNSILFVTEIYELTKSFPESEKFGLMSQMQRCAVSIPSNIAEGAARQNEKEFKRFLFIALGSASELETQLIIAQNLSYISHIDSVENKLNEIRRMIVGLIKYLENKTSKN
jgi:four helix bundle protein